METMHSVKKRSMPIKTSDGIRTMCSARTAAGQKTTSDLNGTRAH